MSKNIRILSILKKLALSKRVCIKELANEYGVGKRTIQKDFEKLYNHFSDSLIKKGDCYSLLNQEHFTSLFKSNPKTTREFLKLVSIVDSALYQKFIDEQKELIEALRFSSNPIYQIENSPYEHLKHQDREILEILEESIANRRYINISYHSKVDDELYSHSIPIRILYLNDNWYLVVLTTNDSIDGSEFKQLRISSITAIKEPRFEPKIFDRDNIPKLKAERFMKNIQSAYSNMDRETYTVLLNVSVKVAQYFKKKKYLKSQKVLKELEGGDILLSYEICNDMEVIPIIQRWIPHLRVIEPLRIRDKIEENLRLFMNRG
jgi:predicted DNA-binding transcriptional regulator YafY